MHETLFLEQYTNIVNTVTLQSILFICSIWSKHTMSFVNLQIKHIKE